MKVTNNIFKTPSEIVGVNISDPVQEEYYNWTRNRLLEILAKDLTVPDGTPVYVINVVGQTSDAEIMEKLRTDYCARAATYRVHKWYYTAWTKTQSLATLRPMVGINRFAIVALAVNDINRTATDYKLVVRSTEKGCLQVTITGCNNDTDDDVVLV